MTASELRELIVREIARTQGGDAMRWRTTIGRIMVYPRETHSHCNWDIRPAGSGADIAAVERAVDAIRPRRPFIDED